MLVRRRALTAKLSLLLAATAAVCLAQFPPPSDSGQYAAKVLTMTGQVSVLKDLVPIALVAGDQVQVQQMIVTGADGHATFQVSDGSTFEVFPNSHLVFRKNAWNVKDLIDLLVGRIRVHIEHFGAVPNPNRILTPTAVISVRGTTFDVTVGEDDETTTVEVEDGLVEVRHALLPSATKMVGAGRDRSRCIETNRWWREYSTGAPLRTTCSRQFRTRRTWRRCGASTAAYWGPAAARVRRVTRARALRTAGTPEKPAARLRHCRRLLRHLLRLEDWWIRSAEASYLRWCASQHREIPWPHGGNYSADIFPDRIFLVFCGGRPLPKVAAPKARIGSSRLWSRDHPESP